MNREGAKDAKDFLFIFATFAVNSFNVVNIKAFDISEQVATRSTCRHRHVGAIIVRDKRNPDELAREFLIQAGVITEQIEL